MANRTSRNQVAEAIDDFLDGKIDNRRRDDLAFSERTDDMLCFHLRDQLWFFYNDIKRYRNVGATRLPKDSEQILRRWSGLLRSEIDWSDIVGPSTRSRWRSLWNRFIVPRRAPKCEAGRNPYWPFASAEAWAGLNISHPDGRNRAS